MSVDAEELVAELESLARELPVPHPSWHGFVPEMREMTASLLVATAAIRTLPEALEELARQVEGSAEYPPDDAGGAALAEARRQLRRLPLPAGQHPFLDEIVPTYEAAEAALAALAAVPGGEEAFLEAHAASA